MPQILKDGSPQAFISPINPISPIGPLSPIFFSCATSDSVVATSVFDENEDTGGPKSSSSVTRILNCDEFLPHKLRPSRRRCNTRLPAAVVHVTGHNEFQPLCQSKACQRNPPLRDRMSLIDLLL